MTQSPSTAGLPAPAPRPLPSAAGRSALTGPQKALVFLVSVDEVLATRILAHLTPEEVKQLREVSMTMQEVPMSDIVGARREFVELVRQGVPASLRGSSAYLRRLAGKALGEGPVAELWSEGAPNESGPIAGLLHLDPSTLTGLLQSEHPQTVAVVLSQLEAKRASEVLAELEPQRRAEVVRRLAQLESIPEAVLEDIGKQFESEVVALGGSRRKSVDGVKAASQVLKRMPPQDAAALIEHLSTSSAEIATKLQRSLFTFEDLVRADSRGMQTLLKNVPTEQLVIALKTASDDLKEKIFGNLSSRAAAVLRDELDMLGPVRLSEVEEAQVAIADVAMALERDGKIQIAREGGADYV